MGIPDEQLLADIGLKGAPELGDLLYEYYVESSKSGSIRALE